MEGLAATSLVGVALIYYIVGILFIIYFHNEDLMQKRQPTVILLMSISSSIVGMEYMFSAIDYFQEIMVNTECTMLVVISNFFCPVWMFALFLRCAHLAATYTHQRVQVNQIYTDATTKAIDATRPIGDFMLPRDSASFTMVRSASFDGSSFSRPPEPKHQPKTRFEQWTHALVRKLLKRVFQLLYHSEELFYKCTRYKTQKENTEAKDINSLKISKASIPILLIWICLAHLVYVGISIAAVTFILHVDPVAVGCYTQIHYLTYLDAVIFMILAPLFLVAIRSMKDSLFIRFELNVSIILFCISFILYLYDTMGVAAKDRVFNNLTPLIFCSLVTFFLSTYLPTIIILYHWYQHSKQLNCTLEDMDKVLQDSVLCKELRKVAAKQFTIESINYLLDMKDLERRKDPNFPDYLYDTYIKPDAAGELNIPSDIRNPIEKAHSERVLTIAHFDSTEQYIKSLILFNTFSEYVAKKYTK